MTPYPDEPREEDRDEQGVTEEFEAAFGDEFGADVADDLAAKESADADHPAGADAGASEAEVTPDTSEDVSGSEERSERAETEQPAGIGDETVEADVLALGDEEQAREGREQAAREAGAALEAQAGGDGGDGDVGAPGAVEDDEEAVEAGEGEEALEDDEEDGEEEAPPSEPEAEPEKESDEPPRVGLWARFLSASLVIVISMATATATTVLLELSAIAEDLQPIPGVGEQLEGAEGGSPQTILVLGSDRRPEIEEEGRSDTTMLLRIDPDQDAIALLSLPRDLKVNIPAYGLGKLNDAYTVGGPKKTLEVVQQLTGLEINHVVNVDFQGFEQAINAIDCVYVDVDRQYFHTNEGLSVEDYFSEIDIQAGYQLLCGDRALQYVRYRHTDNDIIRAARQQDFLREARQKIGPSQLINDRDELIKIFTKYTSSDIDNGNTMLQVLKTFVGAADAPVKQVHFQGTLGESYVTASNEQIKTAVKQFLGLQDTPGSLGDESGDGKGDGGGGDQPKEKEPKPEEDEGPALIDSAGAGVAFADQFAPAVEFPVYYPTKLVPGAEIIEESREYKIADEDKKVHTAYKLVFSLPGSSVPFEYFGLMGTTWTDPPILDDPTETREVGGRTYDLFYDGDRLRLVAWRTNSGTYWLNNTLTKTLDEDEMIAIADSMDEVAPPKPQKKPK